MPIGPIGSVTYANQMIFVQAIKQADAQNALHVQHAAALAMQNEKESNVQEVVATEESYQINPDKEHERQKHEEESGANQEQYHHKDDQENQTDTPQESTLEASLLDIKA